MIRPRRVPWSSKAELVELYELLFAPDSDGPTRARGIARMCVYLASPSCPAFLPLLHSLISAAETPEPRTAEEAYRLRLVYAMAIVRFVNGIVDPLQTGPYARPIAHIAATLGIPPSLISLRHRATHEDLPPLPTLQQAVRMAIQYLHDHSFLPLVAEPTHAASTSGNANGHDGAKSEAAKLVKRWKKAMKSRLRDKEVDEETPNGREIRAVKRALERVDVRDVVDALLAPGGLVPLARSKRPDLTDTSPGPASTQIWSPLLSHLVESHPDTVDVLCYRLMAQIISPGPVPHVGEDDADGQSTYRWALATWILQFWSSQDDLLISTEIRQSVWKQLLGSLIHPDAVRGRLYHSLLTLDTELRPLAGLVVPKIDSTDDSMTEEEDVIHGLDVPHLEILAVPDITDLNGKLEEMQRRLDTLGYSAKPLPSHQYKSNEHPLATDLPPGWTRLSKQKCKPPPIGFWST